MPKALVLFGFKINTFELFTRMFIMIFLTFYMTPGIKKWAKATALDFQIYVAKLVKCIVVVAFVFVLGSASISVWALFFDVF